MMMLFNGKIHTLIHGMFRGQKCAEKVDSGFHDTLSDRILENPQLIERKAEEITVLCSHMRISCRKK